MAAKRPVRRALEGLCAVDAGAESNWVKAHYIKAGKYFF
jgi:hypothetical protein